MALHDFGVAVRWLRETTKPAAVGLPVGGVSDGGRRARGLRREELAELVGVSADHVRRLEQGRRHPSASVVSAIARALRVGRAEYERLCAPAGHVRDWNVAWRTFRNALGGISRTEERAAGFQAMLVARLRSTYMRYPADASLAELVDELRSTSRPFDTLWRTPRTVAAYENRAVFRHPDGGDITLDGNLLEVPGDGLMAVVLTAAPGSTDVARLGEIVRAPGKPAVVRVGQAGPR